MFPEKLILKFYLEKNTQWVTLKRTQKGNVLVTVDSQTVRQTSNKTPGTIYIPLYESCYSTVSKLQ